jgi:hypothetical protein
MADKQLQTNDLMKKTIITVFLSVFLNFLFSCKQVPITKDNLIGVWQGEKQNGTLIKDKGFNSIKLTFTNDSVEVIVDMKAFGGQVTTKSSGPWELNKNIIKTRFGDHTQECLVILNNKTKTLTFKPDLFFKPESVVTSEYKKNN